MADLADPVDEGLTYLASCRRRVEGIFDRDGVRDPEEAAALALFARGVTPIEAARRWQRFTGYVTRGGDVESRYGRQLAADAGYRIERLEVPRQRSRVVRIQREDGPEAA